jgi:hypothetical protein
MMGWCEVEDSDAADKPVHLYAVWTASLAVTLMRLCPEHAALLADPQEDRGIRKNGG